MTPLERLRARTVRVNLYRREAQRMGIGSPYRQGLYIGLREKGLSIHAAYAQAVSGTRAR